jgi:hypothetical protein
MKIHEYEVSDSFNIISRFKGFLGELFFFFQIIDTFGYFMKN